MVDEFGGAFDEFFLGGGQEVRDEFGGDFDEFDEFGGHFLVCLHEKGACLMSLGVRLMSLFFWGVGWTEAPAVARCFHLYNLSKRFNTLCRKRSGRTPGITPQRQARRTRC